MKIKKRSDAIANGEKFYFTGKPCKNGHTSKRLVSNCGCYECSKESSNSSYGDWYKRNKEEKNAKSREYYALNRDKIGVNKSEYRERNYERISSYNKKYGPIYRSENKEKIKQKNAKWYIENREKALENSSRYRAKNKEKVRARQMEYNKKNTEALFIRRSLNRLFSNWRGGRRNAEIVLGYSFLELREHLESLFECGMSWGNRSEWHIDHIKPVSAFIREGVTDPGVVNALSNLRPLWASENMAKGSTYQES